MPSPETHYVIEYRAMGAADVAALNVAIAALLAANPNWQPWGSLAVTTGAGDTHHQAMVLYGPQLNVPTGGV